MLKDFFDEKDNKKVQNLGVERQRDKEKKKPERKKKINPYNTIKQKNDKKVKKKK
jgi:hypothetical protein|tara:strand:- start:533 stop:697 length:165 start_codon:yes stop_codon:yes gene_type:complete